MRRNAKKRATSSPFRATWNLDDMLAAYSTSGTLPARLLPTLPALFRLQAAHDSDSDIDNMPMSLLDGREREREKEKGEKRSDKEKNDKERRSKDRIERKPEIEKEKEKERIEKSDRDKVERADKSEKAEKVERSDKEKTDKERDKGEKRGEKVGRDAKEIKDRDTPRLAHPLPKKPPATVASALAGSRGTVRWVIRGSGSDKPRFLLRVTFTQRLGKYRSTFTRGLGILLEEPKSERKEKSEDKRDKKEAKDEKDEKDKLSVNVKDHAFWSAVADETQEQVTRDSSTQPLTSLVARFDRVIVLCLACEAISLTNSPSDWMALHKELSPFAASVERCIRTNAMKDRQKAYLSFLVGVVTHIRALVLKRANDVLQTAVDEETLQNETAQALELSQQTVANFRTSESHFAEAQSFFTHCPPPPTIFPQAWQHRATSIPRLPEAKMAPATGQYYLPLGPYLDLSEGCAYLLACLREFVEVCKADINGGKRYTFQCTKRQ